MDIYTISKLRISSFAFIFPDSLSSACLSECELWCAFCFLAFLFILLIERTIAVVRLNFVVFLRYSLFFSHFFFCLCRARSTVVLSVVILLIHHYLFWTCFCCFASNFLLFPRKSTGMRTLASWLTWCDEIETKNEKKSCVYWRARKYMLISLAARWKVLRNPSKFWVQLLAWRA